MEYQPEPVNVLLIEDDQGDIDLTVESLKRSKLLTNLEYVKDGREALKYLKKEGTYQNAVTPDVILLDLNLPGMDGREVLTNIKSSEKLKTIPVVILTTSDEEGDVMTSYDHGANCYITKPVDFHKFTKIVQDMTHFWFQVVKLPKA